MEMTYEKRKKNERQRRKEKEKKNSSRCGVTNVKNNNKMLFVFVIY